MSRWTEELDSELTWREAELASLKHHAISTRMAPLPHRAALRALWAMLYAHFEGFTKFCWELALDEIEKSRVKRSDLSDSLAIASLEGVFSSFRGNISSDRIWAFAHTDLPNELALETTFDSKCRFSTDSNLWPDVFRRETQKLGISCSELDRGETLLKALVSRRNQIAHGEKMIIRSLNEYQPYEDATVAVMYDLAIAIVDFLDKKAYLRT